MGNVFWTVKEILKNNFYFNYKNCVAFSAYKCFYDLL